MSDESMTRRTFMSGAVAGSAALMALPGLGAGSDDAQVARTIMVGAVPGAGPGRGLAGIKPVLEAAQGAGVVAIVVPVIGDERRAEAMEALLHWRRLAADLSTLGVIGTEVADWTAPRRRGRVVMIGHSHGFRWVDRDLDLVGDFRANGLRLAKLSSGWRGLPGDGAYESSDLGLTRFGRQAVGALNRAGIVIDLSSSGRKTSLETMGLTSRPVVFSHANARAVHDHPLNLTDEQIRACAKTGGVVGLSAFPALVSSGNPSADDILRHLDHVVKLVGVEHVALGLDFDSRPIKRYSSDPLPEPPYRYPTGLAGFNDLSSFAARLAQRGLGAAARTAILGGNWERVFRLGWGSAS